MEESPKELIPLKRWASCMLVLLLLCGCSVSSSDWAFHFVIYRDHIYELKDSIPADQLQEKLGRIKAYSDHEAAESGNFGSNRFRTGAEVYSIRDIDPQEAIAVVEDGVVYRLQNRGAFGK